MLISDFFKVNQQQRRHPMIPCQCQLICFIIFRNVCFYCYYLSTARLLTATNKFKQKNIRTFTPLNLPVPRSVFAERL